MNKILKSLGFLIGLFTIHLISGGIVIGILSLFNKNINELDQYKFLITFIINLITLILLILIYSISRNKIYYKDIFRKISLQDITYIILFGIGLSIVFNIALSKLIEILSSLIPNYLSSYYSQIQIQSNIVDNSFLQLILAIIIVPIFEEILFRYIIFEHLKKNYNIVLSIIVQALIFGLAHGHSIQIISAFILGILLGLIYIRYKSIVASIVLHMTINSMALIIINTGLISSSYIVHIISIIVAIICLIFSIYKFTRKNKDNYTNA